MHSIQYGSFPYYDKNVPRGEFQALFQKILRGVPSMATSRDDHYSQPLNAFLEKLITKAGHAALTAQRHALVADHPADHPVLNQPYWFPPTTNPTRDEIKAFWDGICTKYSLQQCNVIPTPAPFCPSFVACQDCSRLNQTDFQIVHEHVENA